MEIVTTAAVTARIKKIDEQENDILIKQLLENAKAAIFGAVELHNKPIFPCRYEVSIILTINAWEMATKAFILRHYPGTNIFEDDGKTKPFDKCVSFITHQLGKEFLPTQESIELLYKYRCEIIHFLGQGIEAILYSLLRPNILFFSDFLKKYFEIDLSDEANLIILPIGFKRIISPIDFLNEKSLEGNAFVRSLIDSIKKSAQALADSGFEDGVLCNYKMHIEKEHNIKNADIIVGVTQDKEKATFDVDFNKKMRLTSDTNAQVIRLDEESIFRDHFFMTYTVLLERAKKEIEGFKLGQKFNKLLIKIKNDENLFRKRCLDINPRPKSIYKPYYSELAIEFLKKEWGEAT